MGARHIVGLDIGTTKVCVVVASEGSGGYEILGTGIAPARGMKKGLVADMDAATESIRRAVLLAERSSGVTLRAAYIGVAGGHVQCLESFGATGIKDRTVTRRDVERVIDSASTVYVPLDREVLHILPTDYAVDGEGGITDPLGMSGTRLEAKVRVITASQSALENLLRCCRAAGISETEAVFEPIASCRAVVKPYELASGVAVIDLGGGTTDVAVYREGRLRHAEVLSVGGSHLTNDLSIGLRVSPAEAERVKKEHGHTLPGAEVPDTLPVTTIDGVTKHVPGRYIGEILLPRCEEMFELIAEGIRRELQFEASSCVVLTGGTALLRGIDRVAEARTGLPVRIGTPRNFRPSSKGAGLRNPMYSTAMGLLQYGFDAEGEDHDEFIRGVRARFRHLVKSISGVFAMKKTILQKSKHRRKEGLYV
jgi:cell division protein FtsA